MEVVEVLDCGECEAKFCEECGDVKSKLCYDCQGWDDEGLSNEDWNEEDLN